MAEIHEATLTPSKLELLPEWLARQRWYTAKGRLPTLRLLGRWRLDDPAGEVGIETLIVLDEGAQHVTGHVSARERHRSDPGTHDRAKGAGTVYQVPLTYRGAPLKGADHALVGTLEHSVLGRRWVYDACHDPVYAAEVLRLAQGLVSAASSTVSDTPEPEVEASPSATWPGPITLTRSRVLTGEQSNTSIIGTGTLPDGHEVSVVCKVFRAVDHGDNPDVTLQSALTAAGCTRVPATIGVVSGAWERPDGARRSRGHLVLAQEFLTGAEDAFRVTTRTAAAGTPFGDRARALGEATAEVHELLARSMPTEPARPERIDEVIASMEERLVAALAESPGLARHESAIRRVFGRVRDVPWPAFQRVDGDYHLGQVLDVPGRGWVLIDFEGEPLRPLAERNRSDQCLRDIAGMLRSFDYTGATVELAQPGHSAAEWVADAQSAFLDGYAHRAGHDPRDDATLLTAFLLDKALYEVVYEARHRPTWLPIPTRAIDALVGADDKDPR